MSDTKSGGPKQQDVIPDPGPDKQPRSYDVIPDPGPDKQPRSLGVDDVPEGFGKPQGKK